MDHGRTNQKARTRMAILDAAVELLRDGEEVTVPAAAERALVSVATAYRYFPSADLLAQEAAYQALEYHAAVDEVLAAIEAAGDDVHARLEAQVRALGRQIFENQALFRQAARSGIDTWFAQQRLAPDDRTPVRMGRRTIMIRSALAPLVGLLTGNQLDRLIAALVVAVGIEAVVSLTDIALLEPDAAIEVLVTTCRWILDGALADAGIYPTAPDGRH